MIFFASMHFFGIHALTGKMKGVFTFYSENAITFNYCFNGCYKPEVFESLNSVLDFQIVEIFFHCSCSLLTDSKWRMCKLLRERESNL